MDDLYEKLVAEGVASKFIEIPYSEDQLKQWRAGKLHIQWYEQYPMLFDHRDLSTTTNQAPSGYRHGEWLTAIEVYERFGYLSLQEGFEFEKHKRKAELMREILPHEVAKEVPIAARDNNVQCPDLLCFLPDYSDWFFCEVKKGADAVGVNQYPRFKQLYEVSKRRIQFSFPYLVKSK